MTPLRRIAACLVIAAQAILALAVPAGAAHASGFDRREEIRDARDPHACRGADGTWVLGIGGLGHRHHGHDHDHRHDHDHHHDHHHDHAGNGPDSCCPDRGGAASACLDCADAHTHLHVANVDEVRDGSRRWCLPPLTACGQVLVSVDRCGESSGPIGPDRPERASRPPPSSRRALGSIVLRV